MYETSTCFNVVYGTLVEKAHPLLVMAKVLSLNLASCPS